MDFRSFCCASSRVPMQSPRFPTRSFWANATYMEMILWAYDLVLAFQFLCLPKEVRHWNISTLRRELRWLPAEWAPTGQSETPHAAGQVPSPGPVFETPAGDFQSQAA